jgi:hypothetical protein
MHTIYSICRNPTCLPALCVGLLSFVLFAPPGAAQEPTVDILPILVEAPESQATFHVHLLLSHPSESVVTLHVSTADVTATANLDYVPFNDIVTFLPGEVRKTITLRGVDDVSDESRTESFVLRLTDARGAILTHPSLPLTIQDDDDEVSVSASPGAKDNAPRSSSSGNGPRRSPSRS